MLSHHTRKVIACRSSQKIKMQVKGCRMYCLFSDLFIKIADWTLSTVLHLFCLEVHWVSSRSLVEVQWTEHLAKYELFLSLSSGSPLEVHWKSDRHRILASPTISASKWLEQTFIGLCLDQQWNLVISNGFQQTPMELWWTVHWICWKWQGPTKVHQNPLEKQWECKVLIIIPICSFSKAWLSSSLTCWLLNCRNIFASFAMSTLRFWWSHTHYIGKDTLWNMYIWSSLLCHSWWS